MIEARGLSKKLYDVSATTEGWLGPISALALVLSARFGIDAEQAEQALGQSPRIIRIASAVDEVKSDELREVLARIGVTAFVQPTREGGLVNLGQGPVLGSTSPPAVSRSPERAPVQSPPLRGNTIRGRPATMRTPPRIGQGTSQDPNVSDKPESWEWVLEEFTVSEHQGSAPGSPLSDADRLDGAQLPPGSQRTEPGPPSIDGSISEDVLDDRDERAGWSEFLDAGATEQGLDIQVNPSVSQVPPGERPRARGWSAILGEDTPDAPEASRPARSMTLSDHAQAASWSVSIKSLDEEGEPDNSGDLLDLVGDIPTRQLLSSSGGYTKLESELLVDPPQTPLPLDKNAKPWALESVDRFDNPEAPSAEPKPKAKDVPPIEPWIPALLSVVVPGAGQLYNGQILKGLLFGITAWLVLPWPLSVWDAWRGAQTPGSKGLSAPSWRVPRLAAYFVVWLPLAAVVSWQFYAMSTAQLDKHSTALDTALVEKRDAVVVARGEAGIVMAKAWYRAERKAREVEKEDEEADGPKPGDPMYGLSKNERARRARQLVIDGRTACARKAYARCQELMQKALEFDGSNKDAWTYIVLARQNLGANVEIPNINIKNSPEFDPDTDDSP